VKVLSLLLAIVLTGGCNLCRNEIVAEIPSPKGDKRAVVFQRDCGATTGFSTQVSILSRGIRLRDEGGNAFVADDDHGAVPHMGNVMAIDVRWTSNDDLMIDYMPHEREFSGTILKSMRSRFDTHPERTNVRTTNKRIPFEKIRGLLRRPGQKAISVREMDKGIEQAVGARWKRASRAKK
jgi:hypothetical protein